MENKKVLNLYAGIGGNRKLWLNVDVTALEFNPEIAKVYQDFYPNDKVIIADAHQYLIEHYKEFDFIWTSPPCQTHSSFRFNIGVRFRGVKEEYPDMRLYQEIMHLFWSNFKIPETEIKNDIIREAQIPDLQKLYGFDLSKYKLQNKRQILRNCVSPELGQHIFKSAFKEEKQVALNSLPILKDGVSLEAK